MNDNDLRGQFDALVDRVPPNVDAEPLVRRRASRIRRRRASVLTVGVVLIAIAAVAVPETLQHQGKSQLATAPNSAAAAGLTNECSPALTRAATVYGDLQQLHGLRTSGRVAAGFAPQLVATVSPSVDFCLVVGKLDNLAASAPGGAPAASRERHYAVLADDGSGPLLVYAAAALPTLPLPGISQSWITPYDPEGEFFRPSPLPSGAAVPSAAVADVRACLSGDLVADMYLEGVTDGVTHAQIDLANLTGTPCSVQGELEFTATSATGEVLSGPAHGVVAPTSVRGVLEPKGAVVLDIGGDQPPQACAEGERVTPKNFVVRVGQVTATVPNKTAIAKDGRTALSGCPGTIYADSARVA
jgi:hypothetical protein